MAAGAGLQAVEDDLLKCLMNKNVLDDAAQPTCIKRFIEGNAEPVALLCDRIYRGMLASSKIPSAPSSSSLLVKAVNEIGRDVTAAHFARLDRSGQYQPAHWLLATKTNDGYCVRFKVLNFHHHISSENAAALHFYECGKEKDAPLFVARIKVLPKPKTDQVPLPDPKWTSQELVEWLKANEDYSKAVDRMVVSCSFSHSTRIDRSSQ